MPGQALLWKLQLSRNSPYFIFLFGTMHSGTHDAIHRVEAIKPFIDQCSSYFGESDLDSLLFSPMEENLI